MRSPAGSHDGRHDVMGREPDTCSAPYRVRFDEAAPDGLLRTSVLLRYAQDLAWFHSASRGFDRAWYAERELTWLVRAAEIDVLRPVRTGSELVGTTRVVGSRRVWARRRTDFRDPDGAVTADVRIDWLLLDGRGRPTRIPAEFEPIFGMTQEPVELARVDLSEAAPDARRSSLVVRPQELDPMDHVNNAVYADWVEEQVIAIGGATDVRAVPRQLRLEYARAAEAGSTVGATTWREPRGSWSCRIVDAEGNDVLRASLSPGR
jgi:acyl-ACP thioesterase